MEFKISNKENQRNDINILETHESAPLKNRIMNIIHENEELRDQNECLHSQQVVLVSMLKQKETHINNQINSLNPKLRKNAEVNTENTKHADQSLQIAPTLKPYSTNTSNSWALVKSQGKNGQKDTLPKSMQLYKTKHSIYISLEYSLAKHYMKKAQVSINIASLRKNTISAFIQSVKTAHHTLTKCKEKTIQHRALSSVEFECPKALQCNTKYRFYKRQIISIHPKLLPQTNANESIEEINSITKQQYRVYRLMAALNSMQCNSNSKKMAYYSIKHNNNCEALAEKQMDASAYIFTITLHGIISKALHQIKDTINDTHRKEGTIKPEISHEEENQVNSIANKEKNEIVSTISTKSISNHPHSITTSTLNNANCKRQVYKSNTTHIVSTECQHKKRVEDLTALITQLKEENDKQYDKNKALQANIRTLEEQILRNEKDKLSCDNINETLASHFKELEIKYNELIKSTQTKSTPNFLIQAKKSSDNSINDMHDRISMLECRNQDLQKAVDSYHTQIYKNVEDDPHIRLEYAQKYNEAQEKMQEYEEIILDLKSQITSFTEEINILKDKEDDFEENIRQTQELNKVITKENQEKGEALNRFNELNQSLINEQKKCKLEVAQFQKQIRTEKAKQESIEAELNSIRAQYEAAKQEINNNKGDINQTVGNLAADKKMLIEQLEIAAQDIKKLKDSYTSQIEHINLANKKIEYLESQVSEHDNDKCTITSLQSQIDALSKEKIERQYKSATTAKKSVPAKKTKQIEVSFDDIDDVEKSKLKCQQLRDVNAKLQSSVMEKNSMIDKLKAQNNEVTKELLNATNELSQIKHIMKDMEDKIKKAEEEKSKCVATLSQYKQDCEEGQHEMMQKMQSECEKAKGIERKYEQTISKEKAEYQRQIELLKREINNHQAKINELNMQLNHSQEISYNECSNIKNQAMIAQQNVANAEKEKNILLQKISQLQREYDKVVEITRNGEKQMQEKEGEIAQYRQKSGQTKEELEKAFEELENYAKILERLELKVANLQKEKENYNTQNETLKKELKEMKNVMCNN